MKEKKGYNGQTPPGFPRDRQLEKTVADNARPEPAPPSNLIHVHETYPLGACIMSAAGLATQMIAQPLLLPAPMRMRSVSFPAEDTGGNPVGCATAIYRTRVARNFGREIVGQRSPRNFQLELVAEISRATVNGVTNALIHHVHEEEIFLDPAWFPWLAFMILEDTTELPFAARPSGAPATTDFYGAIRTFGVGVFADFRFPAEVAAIASGTNSLGRVSAVLRSTLGTQMYGTMETL